MAELPLLLLRLGFLLLLWFFVFAVVYSLRADLFGVKVRKLPAEQAAAVPASAPAAPAAPTSKPASAKPTTGPAILATAKRLVITSGPKAGLELPLTGESLSIGRSSESALVIRDDYTSSHHARLVLRGDSWTIEDLDSTNGTFVNGKRVTGASVSLSLGTPIKVGATTFELRA
ncbi:FHA domain-containing protein FhaB [Microbacterium hydrocarbonoxydans]|uniref:FHA domain-containing protein FhaB n=1 Tax=Microbacterium hydrocarbonoxydans TaxID=273678 RepID=A0A0M2HUT6_9MICO|nr:FHA domain-containing protein [Microbacterium hydrocarbonoxydans]KJL48203.1 FHA domain-containing protein FhaB [Microbacterium hydrocarbonoxydans]